MKEKSHTQRAFIAVLGAALGTACYLGGNNGNAPDSGANPDGSTVLPFQADSPYTYVAKVKNILTGLAPTQVEVDSVENAGDTAAQQAALVTLIDTWMTYPQYSAKMQTFFELAFQQTQISATDFSESIPNGNGGIGTTPNADLLIQNVKESFARTVLELFAEGKTLRDAFTTTRFMMTPALAELYAFMDWNQVNDADNVTPDRFATQFATIGVTVEDTTNIAYSETVDATNPNGNYMHWYFAGLNAIQPQPANPAGCQVDTRTWISTNQKNTPSAHLVHYLLYGALEAYKINQNPPPNNNCNAYQPNNTNAVITGTDFSNWQMVNVRQPSGSEATTPFWDMTKLRTATELVLTTPRLGFFSTPAFQANWQTNTSNTMRVTINQSLIVALGAQVDGTDTTSLSTLASTFPGSPPGLDTVHTAPGGACLSCHQILDPTRSIFRATYTNGYGQETSTTQSKGAFIFNGVINQNINSIGDLANQFLTHPLFAGAWVQKLCYYVNSQGCDAKDNDPELARITADFISSGYSWNKLVEELMSSPMTTNAVATVTTTNEGEMVSVTRRDHLCTLLNSRLNLVDSCGLDIVTTKTLTGIPEIAAGLPSDGYGRGAASPVLPTDPSLFYRAGLENICEDVANEIIDSKTPPTGATTFASTDVTGAIAQFVTNIMAIVPDDPRYQTMIDSLTAHNAAAIASKATATDALKSTFVVACLSPTVAGIGM